MYVSAHRIVSGLLVIATMSRPLGAQQPVTIDVGFSAVRFPIEGLTAVGPALRLSAVAARGPLFATLSGAALGTIGAATGSASLEGGARSRPRGGWSAELGGELSSVVGTSAGGGAGTAIANGRAIWISSHAGSWLRASGSYSNREQASLQGHGLDAGVWWTWPSAQLSFAVAQEWTSAQLFSGPFRTGFAGLTPVRHTDAVLSLHATGERASFDMNAGLRRDVDATRVVEPLVSATAAIWTGDTRAIVFSVAHTLPDWVRGADAVDALSVGMRFMQATPAADHAARLIPVVNVSDSPSGRVLRVRATGARRVDVMGDFTDWQEVALSPNGGVFARAMAIAPGSHRMLVRIDGGAWRPAANTPAVDDDFGGRAGLLVVPDGM